MALSIVSPRPTSSVQGVIWFKYATIRTLFIIRRREVDLSADSILSTVAMDAKLRTGLSTSSIAIPH